MGNTKRAITFDGLRVTQADWNDNSNAFIAHANKNVLQQSANANAISSVVRGLSLSAGATAGTVKIAVGFAYDNSGNPIEILTAINNVALASSTLGVVNYVTIAYVEAQSGPRFNEEDGLTYNTRIEDSYTVTVYTAAQWAVLSTTVKAAIVQLGLVTAQGAGVAINSTYIAYTNVTYYSAQLAPLSVTYDKLSGVGQLVGSIPTVQADGSILFQQSSVTESFDKVVILNLLDKAPGQARTNQSLEYFFGTGIDTDYYMTASLISTYRDQLLNDNGLATLVDAFDVTNPSFQQAMAGLNCDLSSTTLFDVYLGSSKVMTATNTNYDWVLEINTISSGLINLRPRTTWSAFKSGVDSLTAVDYKSIAANNTVIGLKKSGVLANIKFLFNKTIFDRVFQGTSLNIVITKDFQVYKWDGTGAASTALTEANFVYGYEMLLQPSIDGGVTPKVGSTAGKNDAGWDYRRIATNKHVVYTPYNYAMMIGKGNTVDCVVNPLDKYYIEFGTRAYTLKTKVIMRAGFRLDGYQRFESVLKYDITQTQWVDWAQFKVENYHLLGAAFSGGTVYFTWYSHPFLTGDYCAVESSTSTTQLPNSIYQVSVIDQNTIQLLGVGVSGGSPGTCNLYSIFSKNINIGNRLSVNSPSYTTIPFLIDGMINSLVDIFDFQTVTSYNVNGTSRTKNIKANENLVCDSIDLNTLYGKGLNDLIYLT